MPRFRPIGVVIAAKKGVSGAAFACPVLRNDSQGA
jgi:hypothetical protein